MNFIQKRIRKNKIEKELEMNKACSDAIEYIEVRTMFVRSYIKKFAENKKCIAPDEVNKFVWNVDTVGWFYEDFIRALVAYQHEYKTTSSAEIKEELKSKIDYMLQKKKFYRAEFEDIYIRFKSIKGVEIPNRNAILNKMRKSFDFDSSKYYAENVSSR